MSIERLAQLPPTIRQCKASGESISCLKPGWYKIYVDSTSFLGLTLRWELMKMRGFAVPITRAELNSDAYHLARQSEDLE